MIKVDVICGLLGTGKTTLIERMLETVYAGQKVAVIENEAGRVNLDAGELEREGVQVRELSSGCICCSLKRDFRQALNEFGDTSLFDTVVVEPSGVADIRDLLITCEDDPRVRIGRLIMVVNAKKIARLLRVFGQTFIGQIRRVDTVWTNFTEGMTAEEMQAVCQELWKINPLLTIVTCPVNEITVQTFPEREGDESGSATSGAQLFSKRGGAGPTSGEIIAQTFQEEKAPEWISGETNAWTFSENGEAEIGSEEIDRAGRKNSFPRIISPAVRKHQITALCAEMDEPLSEEKLRKLIEELSTADFDHIFRAKGYLKQEDGKVMKVDLAGEEVYTKELEHFDEAKLGKLVVIGYEEQTSALVRRLEAI